MKIDWPPRKSDGDLTIRTIDAHAAGEPLRIVIDGLPQLPGPTTLDRRRQLQASYDHLRRILMLEPRGHADMYGCVVTQPSTNGADFGVLFMHNEGYSTMCGHGIIAVVTALVETGTIELTSERRPLMIDTPAGVVQAIAEVADDGRVEQVAMTNVPSFLSHRELGIRLDGIGTITVDIAFGGAFYAILPVELVGARVHSSQLERLVSLATHIKEAVNEATTILHPDHSDLGFLYGIIFTDSPEDPAHHSRNLCVFADREVDRSPTGTGVSARLAQLDALGQIELGRPIGIESILGRHSVFRGRVLERTQCGSHAAVIPEVTGSAFITGFHEFLVRANDSLSNGFRLGG